MSLQPMSGNSLGSKADKELLGGNEGHARGRKEMLNVGWERCGGE
jgi:hypothetical protein